MPAPNSIKVIAPDRAADRRGADAGRPAVLRSEAFEALTPLPDASVNWPRQSPGLFLGTRTDACDCRQQCWPGAFHWGRRGGRARSPSRVTVAPRLRRKHRNRLAPNQVILARIRPPVPNCRAPRRIAKRRIKKGRSTTPGPPFYV